MQRERESWSHSGRKKLSGVSRRPVGAVSDPCQPDPCIVVHTTRQHAVRDSGRDGKLDLVVRFAEMPGVQTQGSARPMQSSATVASMGTALR
jgi:hypothetical protein